MNITYKDNTGAIDKDTQVKASVFLRFMADEIVNISTPRTPKDRGNLRQDIVKQVLGLAGKIIWGKNYAVYQETKQYKNYTTPGTGPHFAEDSVFEGAANTAKIAKKAGLIA